MSNILEVKNLTKIYPGGILANHNVNFSIKEGEIHALVGENGAGKSTLMKMLFGMEEITDGEIFYKGEKVNFTSSNDAIEQGIGMVHQHFMLVPSLTVAENLVLGIERKKGIFIDKKRCIKETEEIAQKYNFNIDANKKVRDISIGMKQKLEILKVLYRNAKVIILDEPTAVLTPQETEELFVQLLNLKAEGFTIIFISHKLNEVKRLSDRLTILKMGKTIGTYNVDELSEEEISTLMVGREVKLKYEKTVMEPKETLLTVKNVQYTDKFGVKKVDGASFSVKDSEILGIAGIEGNGQSEVIEIIAGLLKGEEGTVALKGEDITNISVKQRREMGLSHIAEDRMTTGCASDLSVKDNIISTNAEEFVNKMGLLTGRKIENHSNELIKKYKVKTSNGDRTMKSLSGGNIQKVIVAREFESNSKVLLVNQPTRGVDVGAIEFIHKKILEKREEGKGIILVSADLTELIGLSDRIIVFCKGKVVGHIDNSVNVSEEELGLYMLGLKESSKESLSEAL